MDQAASDQAVLARLLERKGRDPRNLQLEREFLAKAVSFLTHRSECFVCRHPDVVAETLRLFSFPQLLDDPCTESYLSKLGFCLASCSKCLKTFYWKQTGLGARHEELYGKDALSSFWNLVDEWSVARLLEAAERGEGSARLAIDEILINPRLVFLSEPLHSFFTSHLDAASDEAQNQRDLYVGCLLFVFHADPAVRRWCLTHVATCTERKLKAHCRRSSQFVAECLKGVTVQRANVEHLVAEPAAVVKSFCYLAMYAFDNGVFFLKELWEFADWFRWFSSACIDLLNHDAAGTKLVFRALISCFDAEIEAISSGFAGEIFGILALGLPTAAPGPCMPFSELSRRMEVIFYPTVIRLFNHAHRAGLLDFCDKIVYRVHDSTASLASPEAADQLAVVLYHFLRFVRPENAVFHRDSFFPRLLQDVTRHTPTSPPSNAAAELFCHLYGESRFSERCSNALPGLLDESVLLNLPQTIHKLLWCEYGAHFIASVNERCQSVFVRYVKYFSVLASAMPQLCIDEWLGDASLVRSLILMLNCPVEVVRGTVAKILAKRLGFIAQNFIYSNCTSFVLDFVAHLADIRLQNQPELQRRVIEFLTAFFGFVDIVKGPQLPKALLCVWALHIGLLAGDKAPDSQVLCWVQDIFVSLVEGALKAGGDAARRLADFKWDDDGCAGYRLDNLPSYVFVLARSLQRSTDRQRSSKVLRCLCSLWTRARLTFSSPSINALRIVATTDGLMDRESRDIVARFTDAYDERHPGEGFGLAKQNDPINNFHALPPRSIETGPQDARRPAAVPGADAAKKQPASSAKAPLVLTVPDASGGKVARGPAEHPAPRFSEMRQVSKMFRVEIAPSAEPHRSIKMIDTLSEYQDPALRRKERTAYEISTKKRLAADLSPLFRTILGWDHSNLLHEKILHLPKKSLTTFASHQEYEDAFGPLLLMETKAQILRSLEEMDPSEACIASVASVASVNEFTEVVLECKSDAPKAFSEHDLLLIENDRGGGAFCALVNCVVPRNGRFELKVRSLFAKSSVAILPELREGTGWKVRMVCSLITIIREYQALKGLAYVPVRDFILKPYLPDVDRASLEARAEEYSRVLCLNQSQGIAVAAAVFNPSPFTLIQGPPGTGKTKTIISIIGLILSPADAPRASDKPSALRSKRQILLCAPSNAAVDELVRRIRSHGLLNAKGEVFHPKVVRFGTMENIHDDVKDVTLNVLIEHAMSAVGTGSCDKLREQIKVLEKTVESGDEVKAKDYRQLIQAKRGELRTALRKLDDTRQTLRAKFLSESDIICCTLSGSGHELLSKLDPFFDTVIIDEACQCVETSSLIPMKYKCRSCILVGDPNQLPPTVLSGQAQSFNYEVSLFQRVQTVIPHSVFLLSVQYRMHPEIARFPSKYFYEDRLENGPDVGGRTEFDSATCGGPLRPLLGPYGFFNVEGREETSSLKSYRNQAEVDAAVALVRLLCRVYEDVNFFGRIGVVTPYKQQQKELGRAFSREFGQDILRAIDIDTVDAFQGQEKDIIIFSCVRAGTSVGFLADARRLNVALTRARHKIFILGHGRCLAKSMLWGNLIADAKERSKYFELDFIKDTRGIKTAPVAASFENKAKAARRDARPADQKRRFVIAKPGTRTQAGQINT